MKKLTAFILSSLIFFTIPVYAYEPTDSQGSVSSSSTSKEETITESKEETSSSKEDDSSSKEDDSSSKEEFSEEDLKSLPDSVRLDVPEILQLPELPTGCESVALTIVLKYLGYDLEKTTIAEDYLVHSTTQNFVLGFVGEPTTKEGMGVYPIGLMRTINNFFEEQKEPKTVTDLTGTSFSKLLYYLTEDHPIIIWGTMYMDKPTFSDYTIMCSGKEYRWYFSEHCFVLCGYNLKDRTVTFSDPLEGIVTRNMDDFIDIYNQTGQMAVVITD